MTERVPPITRLPFEILQEIFIRCCHADRNDEGYNTSDMKRAPLVLSHIRRSWRQLALNTPKMWCRLHLDWTTRKRWSPSLIGQLWLSRCGAIPIHLSIRERQDGYAQFKDSGTRFALGYAFRLLSLSLTYDTSFHFEGLAPEEELRLQNLRFPLLQHLELRGFSFNSLASLVDSIRCPQLSKYRLDKYGDDESYLYSDLREPLKAIKSLSGSLVHLNLHAIPIRADELDLLANILPLLSTLSVTVEMQFEPESQQRNIAFINLHRMKLTLTPEEDRFDDNGNPITPSLIFNRLFTPNLVALETRCGPHAVHDNYYIAKEVYEFIHQSECSLQELSITEWHYDDLLNGTRILELASSIPSLRKLSYDDTLDSDGYCSESWSLHHLHEPANDHPLVRVKENGWELLPLLEELHFAINPNVREAVLSKTIGAITRRWKSPNGLKRCQISSAIRWGPDVSKAISAVHASLTKFGVVYTVSDPNLSKDKGSVSSISTPGTQQPYLIGQEDWTAYP